MIGDSLVGKNSFFRAFCDGFFFESLNPIIGIDFKKKELLIEGLKVILIIINTAGQERFRNLTIPYCRNCDGVFIFYDISNSKTFNDLDSLLKEIEKHASKDIKKYLIGTKCDLEDKREITFEQGKKYAENNRMKFFETSAKKNINVSEPFIEMTKEFIEEEKKKKKELKEKLNKKLIQNIKKIPGLSKFINY